MSTPFLLTALLAAAATVCATSVAAAPGLNDTGVGVCIDDAGQIIACGDTGQDAEFGRDVTHPNDANGRAGFRFTRLCNSGEREGEGRCPVAPPTGNGRNAWGCTRDEVTGLTWEVKTIGGRRDVQRVYTFYSPTFDPFGEYGGPADATGFVNAVNAADLCGASDWRLPTPAELVGIADMGITTLPAVDTRFLPNTSNGLYWAAGTVFGQAFAEELAWGTDFAFGFGSISRQFRESPRPVRVVRGAPGGEKRFVVSSDEQEVVDRATGLAWRRCVEGLHVDGAACTGAALLLSWPDALSHAQQQAGNTGVAWRLPNAKELASLLDHTRRSHIDRRAFPAEQAGTQWTSSPILIYRIPRCVSFLDGSTSICNSFALLGLRLVRDIRP
jgi:Protein of unknown function (DUF1566)